jgi:hypothetical protein
MRVNRQEAPIRACRSRASEDDLRSARRMPIIGRMTEFYAGRRYTALTGAAGEYYVAAELSRRGWAASITPKGVERNDVLAQHLDTQAVVVMQVKTSAVGRSFRLSEKNERPTSATNEWYALVRLSDRDERPTFYLVPGNTIAAYLYVDHRLWLAAPGRNGQPHKDTAMRAVRSEDIEAYREGWDRLLKRTTHVPYFLPERIYAGLRRHPLPDDHPPIVVPKRRIS